jgi:hypothetical protein
MSPDASSSASGLDPICRQDELDLVGRRLGAGAERGECFADPAYGAHRQVGFVSLKDAALDVRSVTRADPQPLDRHLSVSERGQKGERELTGVECDAGKVRSGFLDLDRVHLPIPTKILARGAITAALDELVSLDPETGFMRLTGLRTIPTGSKPDHVREIIDKLGVVRGLDIALGAGDRVHPDRLRYLVREGRLSPRHLIDRYTLARRRATIVALLIDLEARLTDAAFEMADRLIAWAFTSGRSAQERQYSATAKDVARLMRLAANPAARRPSYSQEDRGPASSPTC